jgi:putative ATP-dependent endonuclease of the OLD family
MVDVLARRLGVEFRKHGISVLSTEGLNFDAFTPLFAKDALTLRLGSFPTPTPQRHPSSQHLATRFTRVQGAAPSISAKMRG